MNEHLALYQDRAAAQEQLADALKKFEKDYLGRPRLQVQVHFWNDLAIIRLHNVLTPAERKLAEDSQGQALIEETRRKLFESARPLLEAIVDEVLGVELVDIHTDISTRIGERIVVLTVNCDLEARFPISGRTEQSGEESESRVDISLITSN